MLKSSILGRWLRTYLLGCCSCEFIFFLFVFIGDFKFFVLSSSDFRNDVSSCYTMPQTPFSCNYVFVLVATPPKKRTSFQNAKCIRGPAQHVHIWIFDITKIQIEENFWNSALCCRKIEVMESKTLKGQKTFRVKRIFGLWRFKL